MYANNSLYLSRLKTLAKRLGGDVICIPKDTFILIRQKCGYEISRTSISDERFFTAPFVGESQYLGVFYLDKIVLYSEDIAWPGVIHEMGHCFCAQEIPSKTDEWKFFGWEYAVARTIRAPIKDWLKHNKDYVVDGIRYTSIGDLSEKDQRTLLQERLQHAKDSGLVNELKPLAIR